MARFATPPGPYGVEYIAPVTLDAPATQHTKGAWVDLVASTARDIMGFYMAPAAQVAASGQNTSILLDLGIGNTGDAVDDTLVANVPVGYGLARTRWYFPLHVRKGERLAARIQAQQVSEQLIVELFLGYAPPPPLWGGYSKGEVITPMDLATSAPTMGNFTNSAWEEVVASTSRSYRGFNFFSAVTGVGGSSTEHIIDIGVGASGSEQVIGSWAHRLSNTEVLEGYAGPLWIERAIPAGERIAVFKNGGGNHTGAVVGYW